MAARHVARHSIGDIFREAVLIELRFLTMLGQVVARVTVFILVQFMDIVRYPSTLIVDCLSLLLGFEVGAIIGIRRTGVGTDVE